MTVKRQLDRDAAVALADGLYRTADNQWWIKSDGARFFVESHRLARERIRVGFEQRTVLCTPDSGQVGKA